MKLFNKTALAVAISAVAAAPAVFADSEDLAFSGAGETIVLADVIFGNGNPGTGSEETLITAPEVTFDLDEDAGEGDEGAATETATVKFTLGGGAVFGEDLSTTTLLDNSNGGAGAFSLVADAVGGADTITYEVIQGGAIGDNTITIEITFAADGAANGIILESVTFTGYAVKNLQSPLNPSSASKKVELGVEYVEATDNLGDDIASTATDTPLVIFGSQAPFELTATPVDFVGTANFVRINVGNGETTFTGGTTDGRSDFDLAGDVNLLSLGTLQLTLEAVNATTFPLASGNVRKENGIDDFDFQGGDAHTLLFSVGSGELQEGSSVYLHTAADCTSGTTLNLG